MGGGCREWFISQLDFPHIWPERKKCRSTSSLGRGGANLPFGNQRVSGRMSETVEAWKFTTTIFFPVPVWRFGGVAKGGRRSRMATIDRPWKWPRSLPRLARSSYARTPHLLQEEAVPKFVRDLVEWKVGRWTGLPTYCVSPRSWVCDSQEREERAELSCDCSYRG